MTTRLNRAELIMDVKRRLLERAQGALAEATLELRAVSGQRQEAEAVWRKRAEAVAHHGGKTIAEQDEARHYVASLRLRVERLEQACARATAREGELREALLAAERELDKIERWRDGIVADEETEAARRERTMVDEIAARRHWSAP